MIGLFIFHSPIINTISADVYSALSVDYNEQSSAHINTKMLLQLERGLHLNYQDKYN